MGLPAFLRAIAARRRQRSLVRAIDRSPVCFSSSPGVSFENPVVITGAGHDLMGSMAILAWLIGKRGTLGVDWQILVKSGHSVGERHIDVYEIELKSGAKETYYFDITESYGMFVPPGPA